MVIICHISMSFFFTPIKIYHLINFRTRYICKIIIVIIFPNQSMFDFIGISNNTNIIKSIIIYITDIRNHGSKFISFISSGNRYICIFISIIFQIFSIIKINTSSSFSVNSSFRCSYYYVFISIIVHITCI